MTTTTQDDQLSPKPLRKDAARNRQLLIEAAREVFAQRGLDATLDDVARHAGVGVGTAYRHFANKYELAGAILDEALILVSDDARRALEVDDPWEGLVGFLEVLMRLQSGDRGLREVLTGAYDPQRMSQLEDRVVAPFNLLVQRAQAAGVVRADAALSDFGFVVSMLCSVADTTAGTAPDIWRRYLPLLLAGLRPGGPELPVAPLSDETFRAVTAAHKARPNIGT